MVENPILRERARMQLGNQIFSNPWLLMLVVCLIVDAIMNAATAATSGVAAFIVGGPLTYGLCYVTLSCARGWEWKIEHVFCGFAKRFGDSLVLYLLQNLFIALWTLLFVIPGLVKSYSYALAFYIASDNPEMSANDCITESRKMMDGHKWQLFCLDFSFIGWYLLGALCFGIGTLFVVPYHQVERANFYAELKMEKDFDKAKQVAGNNQGGYENNNANNNINNSANNNNDEVFF